MGIVPRMLTDESKVVENNTSGALPSGLITSTSTLPVVNEDENSEKESDITGSEMDEESEDDFM